jgi:outer membrane protein W
MKHIIVILSLVCSFSIQAQIKKSNKRFKPFYAYTEQPFYRHWDLGISFGTSTYLGEISNKPTLNNYFKEVRWQGGVEVNYHIGNSSSIGLETTYGKWYANDFNHQNLYNRSCYGKSVFVYPTIIFKQKLFFRKKRLRPFGKVGFGMNMHDTKIYRISDNALMSDMGVRLAFGISFGGGLIYTYNKNIDIGLDVLLALYSNDDIDNLVYAVVDTDKVYSIRLTLNYKLIK